MNTPKIIKVAKVGGTVEEVAVTERMTVRECIEAAGYTDEGSTVYGRDANGRDDVLDLSTNVNGYVQLVLSENVKGGQK